MRILNGSERHEKLKEIKRDIMEEKKNCEKVMNTTSVFFRADLRSKYASIIPKA